MHKTFVQPASKYYMTSRQLQQESGNIPCHKPQDSFIFALQFFPFLQFLFHIQGWELFIRQPYLVEFAK